MYKTPLNESLWIYFSNSSEDTWSTINHEGFNSITKGVFQDPKITNNFLFSFFVANTEPYSLSDGMCTVYKKNFSSRQYIPIDHYASNIFEYFIDTLDLIGI